MSNGSNNPRLIDIREIPGVVVVDLRKFADTRGHFMEWYHRSRYSDLGITSEFVQDNFSVSKKGTVRGLHYQLPNPQGKLVGVISGAIFDVVVDIRKGSPTFGRFGTIEIDEAQPRQVYVPPGLAHGFCALSDSAQVMYKCTSLYSPKDEKTIRWDDPDLNISWPVESPLISDKDRQGWLLRDAVSYE